MLSSHRFLCLPLCLPPWTVPCMVVLASPDDHVTCLYHFSLYLFTEVRRSSRGPMAFPILEIVIILMMVTYSGSCSCSSGNDDDDNDSYDGDTMMIIKTIIMVLIIVYIGTGCEILMKEMFICNVITGVLMWKVFTFDNYVIGIVMWKVLNCDVRQVSWCEEYLPVMCDRFVAGVLML